MIPLEPNLYHISVYVVSLIALVAMVTLLVQCVCGKKGKNKPPDNSTSLETDCPSVHLDADALSKMQDGQGGTNGDLDIKRLNTSIDSRDSTVHSRGESVDQNKERRSAVSCGSSPRPTASRELPNIPGTHEQRHSTLPMLPSDTRTTSMLESFSGLGSNTLDSHRKTSHAHSVLPDIPSGGGSPANLRRPMNVTNDSRPKSSMNYKLSDVDDYDHISEKTVKKVRPRSDYDHVVIENGERRIIPAKSKLRENDYAEVKNGDFYEQVKPEVTVIPLSKPYSTSSANHAHNSKTNEVTKTDSFNDPYNKIKVEDPPYTRIRDEPPYNSIKDTDSDNLFKLKADSVDDPYNTVKDIQDDLDPYNTVNDDSSARSSMRKKVNDMTAMYKTPSPVYDPYSLMIDDERNVSNQTDPYARVGDTESEIDDPYNKVNDDIDGAGIVAGAEYGDDDYATVNKSNEIEYAKVNKSGNSRHLINPDSGVNKSTRDCMSSPREEIIHDEYATVVKVRKLSPLNRDATELMPGVGAESRSNEEVPRTPNSACDRDQISAPSTSGLTSLADDLVPPEPPRDYDDDDNVDNDEVEDEVDHYNTVSLVSRENSNRLSGSKKEPPYNKLSVRESLASMNARAASNTYEYVAETDNLYATVDGSSGDGSVIRRNTSQHTTDHSIPGAPAPPSLDSLHETAKQHQDEMRRKHDSKPDYYNLDGAGQGQINGHQRTPSGQGHFRTPSGEVMTSSFESRVPMATEENVELDFDPNYQSMNDDKISDDTSEFDPNYETVEEAESKLRYAEVNGARPKKLIRQHIYEDPDGDLKPGETRLENGKIRAHVYEEVKLTNEANRVKQRVLNKHTYEEVSDIKRKGKKTGNSNNSADNSKKKGHERSSSADWLLFGKRKSGEPKDGKKKLNDKNDGNRKSAGQ